MMAHVGVEYAEPGDVLVVAAESDRAATWGVVDSKRDASRHRRYRHRRKRPRLGVAVWQRILGLRAGCLAGGSRQETPGSVNVSVVVGDVSVSPGDIVVGDADG